MKLKFKRIDSDETLNSLIALLDGIVLLKAHQYQFESEIPLNREFFSNSENYRQFFDAFGEFARPIWKSDWDFTKFPFRTPADEIDGLISILRSGGAYSESYSSSEAIELEMEFRHRFRGQSTELVILSVVDYIRTNPESKSFGVSMKGLAELQLVSRWFFQISWDNLIFIINPDKNTFYVIAFTDED